MITTVKFFRVLNFINKESKRLLSLAKSHHNNILIVLSLGIACFSAVTLLKLQEVSKETSTTLEKYREVLAERSVEAAVVEESLGNSTILKIGAGLVIGLSFFLLAYLTWSVAKNNFPDDGSPKGVVGSVEPPQIMGGKLDESFIRSLEILIRRFSDELTQLDFSALVPENFTGPIAELLWKVLIC